MEVVRVLDPGGGGGDSEAGCDDAALFIDGLFGIGLNRPWRGRGLSFSKNQRDEHPRAGGGCSFRVERGFRSWRRRCAKVTLTLGAVKQGFMKPAAWPFVGKLEVASDIGLVPYPFETEVSMMVAEDFSGFPPPRPVAGHKGTFGHLAIIAGSAVITERRCLRAGAQRAQPGLITLITDPEVYVPVAQQLQSVMVRTWKDADAGGAASLPDSCTAVLADPVWRQRTFLRGAGNGATILEGVKAGGDRRRERAGVARTGADCGCAARDHAASWRSGTDAWRDEL